MGAWGTGVFEDDTARDLRAEFGELLADGLSAEAATAELERRYDPASDRIDVEPIFWIALAATQHRWGRLLPEVRDRAVAIIESGQDLERFVDDTVLRTKRAKVLEELKATLLGPARAPRPIKAVKKVATSWVVGQILRYRLASGTTCLFRVVGHRQDKGGRYAEFEVLREETSALRLALTPGLRDQNGKRHLIIVPDGLETSARIGFTDLGRSPIASLMRYLRDRLRRRHGSTLSVILPGKLDLNLGQFFGLR